MHEVSEKANENLTQSTEQFMTAVDTILEQMDRNFDCMDKIIGRQQWLDGEPHYIADTYLTMTAMWHWDIPVLLERSSNVAR